MDFPQHNLCLRCITWKRPIQHKPAQGHPCWVLTGASHKGPCTIYGGKKKIPQLFLSDYTIQDTNIINNWTLLTLQ